MKLKCTRECVMKNTGEVTTTVGKVYEVAGRDPLWGLMIIDDLKQAHWFDEDEYDEQHYRKWFEEVRDAG